MGSTLVEKILALKMGRKKVRPHEYLTVKADRVMVYDLFGPFCIEKFREMGFQRVWDPDRIVLIHDHMVPTGTVDDCRHQRLVEEFAAEQKISRIHRADGICHQLMMECGYVTPGDIVFGTDSHTCTYGALGVFSTGIGYTEMAAVWGTGELWLRVPESIKIELLGALPRGVYAKDVILRIIGDLKCEGANYQALEFRGDGLSRLNVSSRMTLCNMAVEASAKCGLIAADQKTIEFVKASGGKIDPQFSMLQSDPDAQYAATHSYNLSELEPMVACPFGVDQVQSVASLGQVPVQQAFLGSCTNGRLDDLEIAAAILKGRKVASGVRLIVTPASRQIMSDAATSGVLQTLIEAGAIVTHPSCGLCCGRAGGIPADDEVVISCNNRNFLGRLGGGKSKVYLGSPATVAASALAGHIVDPRVSE